MIKREGYLVWIRSFDARRSKSGGRRVPANLAVKNPTPEMIVKAAESLGWGAEPLPLSHPSEWWRKGAAVLIKPPAGVTKHRAIRLIAQKIRGER
jgi:signal recognition particle subunit SRP19